jgi:hypothetical protein
MGTPSRAGGFSKALLLRSCLHWSNHRKCSLALVLALAMALLATNLVMLFSFERGPLHNRQEKLRTREGAIDLCPSSCADGTQIDNSLCPTISNSGLREILSRLTPDSVCPLPRPCSGTFKKHISEDGVPTWMILSGRLGLGRRSVCAVLGSVRRNVPYSGFRDRALSRHGRS